MFPVPLPVTLQFLMLDTPYLLSDISLLACPSLMLDDASLSSSPGLGCQSLMLGSPHPLHLGSSTRPSLSHCKLASFSCAVSMLLAVVMKAFFDARWCAINFVNSVYMYIPSTWLITLIEVPQRFSLAPTRQKHGDEVFSTVSYRVYRVNTSFVFYYMYAIDHIDR